MGELNVARASKICEIAKYVTGEPVIRSGELIEAVDGQAPSVGYMRFTRAIFDPSNYDAMMSSLYGQLEKLFKDISGLYRLRVARIADDRMLAASGGLH